MKIPPEQKVECPKCGVPGGAFCKGKRGRRMLTTHSARKRFWNIREGLVTRGVKVGGRGPFVIPIHLTSDICARCSQPRGLHVAVNYSNPHSTGASVMICPTAIFNA